MPDNPPRCAPGGSALPKRAAVHRAKAQGKTLRPVPPTSSCEQPFYPFFLSLIFSSVIASTMSFGRPEARLLAIRSSSVTLRQSSEGQPRTILPKRHSRSGKHPRSCRQTQPPRYLSYCVHPFVVHYTIFTAVNPPRRVPSANDTKTFPSTSKWQRRKRPVEKSRIDMRQNPARRGNLEAGLARIS